MCDIIKVCVLRWGFQLAVLLCCRKATRRRFLLSTGLELEEKHSLCQETGKSDMFWITLDIAFRENLNNSVVMLLKF